MSKVLKTLTFVALLVALLGATTPAAKGQVARPFDTPGTQQARYAAANSAPTVSPYLNLATTPTGLSNYQSLVRPLIEERESLNRQRAELEQLNYQLRGQGAVDPNRLGNGARLGSSVRFLHYSHYFNAGR